MLLMLTAWVLREVPPEMGRIEAPYEAALSGSPSLTPISL